MKLFFLVPFQDFKILGRSSVSGEFGLTDLGLGLLRTFMGLPSASVVKLVKVLSLGSGLLGLSIGLLGLLPSEQVGKAKDSAGSGVTLGMVCRRMLSHADFVFWTS